MLCYHSMVSFCVLPICGTGFVVAFCGAIMWYHSVVPFCGTALVAFYGQFCGAILWYHSVMKVITPKKSVYYSLASFVYCYNVSQKLHKIWNLMFWKSTIKVCYIVSHLNCKIVHETTCFKIQNFKIGTCFKESKQTTLYYNSLLVTFSV